MIILPLLPPAKLAYEGGEANVLLQAFVQRCSRDIAGSNVCLDVGAAPKSVFPCKK